MALGTYDFTGVGMKRLTDGQRAVCQPWRESVREGACHKGLWVCGERGSGSSFIAAAVVGKLVYEDKVCQDADHVYALSLMDWVREVWSAQSSSRSHESDMGLWMDMTSAQDKVDSLYERSLLWVDDFHHESMDIGFWKRHVQPRLELRVKRKLPTVVTTTMDPDHPLLPARVMRNLFEIVGSEHGVEGGTG